MGGDKRRGGPLSGSRKSEILSSREYKSGSATRVVSGVRTAEPPGFALRGGGRGARRSVAWATASGGGVRVLAWPRPTVAEHFLPGVLGQLVELPNRPYPARAQRAAARARAPREPARGGRGSVRRRRRRGRAAAAGFGAESGEPASPLPPGRAGATAVPAGAQRRCGLSLRMRCW